MGWTIEPIAAESFGIRSMATFIKTEDISLVIDPGCSLGPRFRLDPHPKEYEALYRANQRLVNACAKAEILAISHFHYDHVKPHFTDYHFILSNRELTETLYTDKVILAKDFRENINANQRQRGYYFNKFTKKYAKEIFWADGQRFEYGNTIIEVSEPLSHGEQDSKQGFVISFKISSENETFVYATVQGPILTSTLYYLLSLQPTILYVGGPPVYLSGFRILETTLDLAKNNLLELVKKIPRVIIDHHLLRATNWNKWLAPIYQCAETANHWLGTSAEFSKGEPKILEAHRKELYAQDPPSGEFIKWTKQSKKYKKETLPPSLTAPF